MGKKYNINLGVVYNRVDCCHNRINGAVVYAGSHKCGTIKYIHRQHAYFIPCSGVKADNVKIVLKGNYLQLAEVQVFGKCLNDIRYCLFL